MTLLDRLAPVAARGPVPRGLARSGPAILAYGFRPFFLGAGLFAVAAMAVWIVALTLGWPVGGDMGAVVWHAHEMPFGYAAAALAGFLMTAIPNWTGRLPVSGRPLLLLVLLWVAGRLAMALPDLLGPMATAILDGAFLPVLAAVAGREVIAGRNWKNLKILGGLGVLAAANLWFHASVLTGSDPLPATRLAVGALVVLIAIVGGRIIPSFTRNYLVKAGATRLPAPYGLLDSVAILSLVAALPCLIFGWTGPTAAALSLFAALLNLARLWRWRGAATVDEPLLLVLHVAYLFLPLGLLAAALAQLEVIAPASALHVLTVGGIGLMTLAVTTRATRGHTGRPLTASATTSLSYLLLGTAAVTRPFAEVIPQHYHLLLEVGGACWIAAFALFVVEHAPMLWSRRAAR